MFDLSKPPIPFDKRRALDVAIQHLHSELHPEHHPEHYRCTRCLGMKGKGWARRLEVSAHLLPRRARRPFGPR